MLDLRLELARVDHEKCVEALLPQLVEHCAAKAAPNELDRLLGALGPDAVPAARAMLGGMDTDAKDRLVVWLVAAHEERMRNSANRHLAELTGQPIIRVGRLAALDRPGSRLALQARQVDIDYPALLKSPLVEEGIERIGAENGVLKGAARLALQMGAHLSPENLEKQGLLLLNAGRVKQRLMAVMQEAVCQAGLDVTVEDMLVERSAGVPDEPESDADARAGMAAFLESLAARARKLREEEAK